MKLGILLLGLVAFAALQLSASVFVGRTGLGFQTPILCADCGATGFHVDGRLHRWHLLRVRTYHEADGAAVGCAHSWVDDPAGSGGIACGKLPLLIPAMVDASFVMGALSVVALLWMVLELERRRPA